VALAAGYWWLVAGVCGTYHDDAIYVATAKALAEGRGYRLINLPAAPLQTKYPVLYPALLALIWKLWPSFPDNLWAMQALSLLAGGALTGLSYLYLVRFGYCSRGVALAAGLLCGTSINFLYFSTLTLSEIPFGLLVLGVLWALENQARSPQSSGVRQFLMGVLLGLPYLCRSLGIILAPVGLFFLYRRRRPVLWVAVGTAAVILPWLWWIPWISVHVPQDPIVGYYTDYFTWWYEHGFSVYAQIPFHNLAHILIFSSFLGVPGLEKIIFSAESKISLFFFYFLGLITWIIIAANARRIQLLPLYLAAYLAVVILWPWPPFRFLAPILPFLLAYLIFWLAASATRLSSIPIHRYVLPVALAILLTANLVLVYNYGRVNRETGYPTLVRSHPKIYWSSHEEVFNWIKSHTAPDEVIISGSDSMVYLYTGRPAIRLYLANPASIFYGYPSQSRGTEDILQAMKAYQARYLVQMPVPGEKDPEKDLHALLQESPGVWQPVFVGKDPRFIIYAVRP